MAHPPQASFQFGAGFYFARRSRSFETIRHQTPAASGIPEGRHGLASRRAEVPGGATLWGCGGTGHPVYVEISAIVFLLYLRETVRGQLWERRRSSGLGQGDLDPGLLCQNPSTCTCRGKAGRREGGRE